MTSSRTALARSLALGFAGAVAMWMIAYVAMMRPGAVAGEALFALTLGCASLTGFIAGRNHEASESAIAAGIKAGFVIATVNLLLIGGLIGAGASTAENARRFLFWITGNYAITLALAAFGGAVARSASRRMTVDGRDIDKEQEVATAQPDRNWYSRFTAVVAITVFMLLITGGLVTGLEAGLAVPDWPNSFGHNMLLYPLSEMKEGVYYEHAHRLYGMLVGVSAITLARTAFIFDRRGWFRMLALSLLLMVSLQGYLGGSRVTERSVLLAIAHGVFAQMVFATACAIAVFASPTWIAHPSATVGGAASAPGLDSQRRWTMLVVAALVIQLILGATYRHLLHVHVLYTHILWALCTATGVIFVAGRAAVKPQAYRFMRRIGKAMLHTVGLQIVLGVVAMFAVWSRPSPTPAVAGEATPIEQIPVWEITFTTAHQAVGALLLGLATMLMLWTRKNPETESHQTAST